MSEELPNQFRPSRFTIRVKLLLIVSTVIVLSLSSIIYLATVQYRETSETSIQEYNLSLARIIGLAVETELKNLTQNSRNLAAILRQPGISDGDRRRYINEYFQDNPDYISFALARRRGENPDIGQQHFNGQYLKKHRLRKSDVEKLNRVFGGDYSRSFQGMTVVKNVSPGFGRPALGISLSAARNSGDGIIIVYMDSTRLLRAFRSSGVGEVFQLMMVDETGTVIAHSDENEALARSNRLDIPIVRKMKKSPTDNRSLRYSYKNVDYLGSFQTLDFAGLGIISTVEASRAFETVFLIQERNIKITLIAIALALLVILLFSRTLAEPIKRLVSATRQVEEGDFEVAIRPSTRDEIGVLTNSFLSMAHGLAESERIKETFGKFVSPEIRDLVLREELKLGGENKNCAVLFSDLRNFTTFSESRPPEEVVELLNLYFSNMVECIHRRHGVVDKFIGDAIMAHWGAAFSLGNDTENAIEAALMMRQALIDLNAHFREKKVAPIQFGCGINTGAVIAGQIGSDRRQEYTVIGDTVNLASRIESLNKRFVTDILISQYACEQVRGVYRLYRSPPISIKGKAQAEIVYSVLGRNDDPSTPRTLKELRRRIGMPPAEKG